MEPIASLQSEATTIFARSSYSRRRRKSALLGLIPYLLISGVTAYAAWRMYDATVNRPTPQPAPPMVVAPKKVQPRRVEPKLRPRIVESKPVAPEPPAVVEVAKTKPLEIPFAVTLPPSADGQLATLATVDGECEISLATAADELTLDGHALRWGKAVVAGVRAVDGSVQFRWMNGVPEDAVAAIRNSLLKIKAGNASYYMRLREPVEGEPLKLDMQAATHRVTIRCEALPPVGDIRCEISLQGQIPVKEVKGAAAKSIKVRDEAIVCYDFMGDAATKVTIKSNGEAVSLMLATQYVLPSGDVEAMSIARGTRKMNELTRLQGQAANALSALPLLQQYRQRLNGQLSAAQSMSTGRGTIQNPVAVAQKTAAISSIQKEIAANEQDMQRARRLIADKPSIDLDVSALEKVAELARSINEAPLPYRFYTVADGQEIDLVRWKPVTNAVEEKPVIFAQPIW